MVAETRSFSSYSHLLSPLLLRSLADLGFSQPTLIQAHVIPLALGGGDILARARTGSGKTAAYAIPVVQKILITKGSLQTTRALILVPTRELAEQVTAYIKSLCTYCVGMSVVNASVTSDTALQRYIRFLPTLRMLIFVQNVISRQTGHSYMYPCEGFGFVSGKSMYPTLAHFPDIYFATDSPNTPPRISCHRRSRFGSILWS